MKPQIIESFVQSNQGLSVEGEQELSTNKLQADLARVALIDVNQK